MSRLQKHQLIALTAHEALVASGKANAADFVMPAPLPKKPRNNEESIMQRQLIRWWQLNCRRFGVAELCLFSVPNGGNGDARRGSIMKAEGQRKGAPDLLLAVPRTHLVGSGEMASFWTYHGMFLELKTAKGVLSPEQEVFHEILTSQGYKIVVCRSLLECINQVTAYLNK